MSSTDQLKPRPSSAGFLYPFAIAETGYVEHAIVLSSGRAMVSCPTMSLAGLRRRPDDPATFSYQRSRVVTLS